MTPQLTREQRAAGARINDGVTLRRVYGKADAGRRCSICQTPIVKPLDAAGETTHPTCGDAWEDAWEAYQRTIRRRAGAVAAAPAQRPTEDVPLPEPQPELPDPAPEPDPFRTSSSPGSISPAQLRKLHVTFAEAGITLRDRRLAFCTDTVYRPITTTNDLSLNEAKQVIDALTRIIDGPEQAVKGTR